jgi:integrase
VFANLSAILQAAVDDGAIARNPCRGRVGQATSPDRRKVLPWSAKRVAAVAAALPDRYRAIMSAVAGLGLRQGECFAVAVDDVDFLRGVVHVRRQVRIVASRLVSAPPKTGKTRDVPLPGSVALRLAAHLEARARRGRRAGDAGPWDARGPALLRQRTTRRRCERPGGGRVPRP